ncbi:MAG: nitrous oxide reductase family maturation protein NosD [Gammaproteobacteria bacterium SHHR-1]|uniref:nitrous oxide reductase family maturation protein NosD n=1 Tax=Magnetovirga frankeli TaxID=947516 RepID=UPI001293C070|nr:nitrous oxide reductase family maturation protein NosD [gamma proteobacterium SS-5]
MRALLRPLLLGALVLPGLNAQAGHPPFQELVDATEELKDLVPPPGIYSGPVVIDKPMSIDGRGQVTIDAGGKGSVIVIDSDGVTLQGLRLTNTGESHNDIDSGVQVRGDYNVVKDNVIDNALFGVDLQQSSNNIVRNNRISSKPFDLGMRGDAVRLWYSFNNKITDNIIRDSRDMVVWYSKDNLIARNDARRGRYSLHFMYSRFNEVVDNYYQDNSVGIFLMYSDSVRVKNNTIAYAAGPTGMGIGFKETSDVDIIGNQILYCAVGMYLDVSPYDPEATNRIHDNLVAYSGVGVQFLNDWTGNFMERNRFKGNMTQVVVSGGGKTANRNHWENNYWEDYQGFDLDEDGIGDTPYELYSYADRIWMDVPPAQFFKGSPVMEALDFLERLAPFSEPKMLVRDKRPRMSQDWVIQTQADPEIQAIAPAKAGAETEYDALEALRRSMGQ